MNPSRRKAIENGIVAVLREQRDVVWTLKALRSWVAERLDGCTPPELAGAVQSLRYQGKLAWDRLELSDSMIETIGGAPPPAAEGPEDAASVAPTPHSSGPDDEDDYPGGVNDCSEAAEQGREGNGPLPSEGAAGDVPDTLRQDEPAVPVGRVEEPRPDATLDQPAGAERPGQATRGDAAAGAPIRAPGGWSKASRIAGARPIPAPRHESEVARLVREESNDMAERRRLARSTGTVRQPLELRKFGIPDMNLTEALSSMLSDDPKSIMRAVSRKHPAMWRRVILLARAEGKTPMQTLYDALERGLDEQEAALPPQATEEAA